MGRSGAAGSGPEVYTLLVEVGRKEGDGLPEGASGGALLCHAPGRDEEEAVRETVALLRTAGLAPLEVQSLGSRSERLAAGETLDPEDAALMDRALAENAVVVVRTEAFFEGDAD
ncbi:MAG: hypothetical protein D6832_00820 [Alphaproteobacteria bacterium]|nr:MAG: hypothetical protein D6832_00820 [Alphaproteobacteria bacterium]